MPLWRQTFRLVEGYEVDQDEEKHEKIIMANEILESFGLLEEPDDGPIEDYVTRSEEGKLMENNIKNHVEPGMRRTAT